MTGSLQIKYNKYYAVINLYTKDDLGDKKRLQKWVDTHIPIGTGNKRKAEKFLRNLISQEENKIIEYSDSCLFADYILEWLDGHKANVELTTWEAYERIVKKHIYPYFKDRKVKLQDLTHIDIKKYYQYLSETKKLSANSIKRHHANIRKCLKEAMIDGLVSRNVADMVQLPKVHKYVAEYYNMEELKKLLAESKGHVLETALLLTTYYGLRRSEIAGLMWKCIDMAEKTITIKMTATQLTSYVLKERTKNASSYRTMPIAEEIYSHLLSLRETQAENKLFFGNTYDDNDFVCKWDNGKPIKLAYYSREIKNLSLKAGLKQIRFHDLRHSCATLLYSNDVDISRIQTWLGHSDIATTARIYIHMEYKEKIKVANVLSTELLN